MFLDFHVTRNWLNPLDGSVCDSTARRGQFKNSQRTPGKNTIKKIPNPGMFVSIVLNSQLDMAENK